MTFNRYERSQLHDIAANLEKADTPEMLAATRRQIRALIQLDAARQECTWARRDAQGPRSRRVRGQ